MSALIEARNLTRWFETGRMFARGRPVQAVTDVTFHVARGEAVGLVGESGSGKSTIGRLVLGLISPTAGQVTLDGVDLAEVQGARLRRMRGRMQPVFQDPQASLDPRRRIGDQIADGLTIQGMVPRAGRAARVAELLQQVGLPAEAAGKFPHEFSGGQRQRIGIARALSTNPDFVMADEPVSALDMSVQAQVLKLFADLRSRLGLALLFISHDLPVVRAICDRVIVLYLGRVMEQGPAARILENPTHPYTQALISAQPSLDPARRRKRLLLEGDPPSPASPPSGCVFRTRCPIAIPACAEAVPELRTVEPGHQSACIRIGEASLSPAARSPGENG